MAVSDFILKGVKLVESTLGNPTFTWKGESFACVPNTVNDSVKSDNVGFNENADFRMTVRTNQFAPNIYPRLNDYVYYQGYKLLVKGIKKPAHNVFWIYLCELSQVSK
jgi:hypothetical protein